MCVRVCVCVKNFIYVIGFIECQIVDHESSQIDKPQDRMSASLNANNFTKEFHLPDIVPNTPAPSYRDNGETNSQYSFDEAR